MSRNLMLFLQKEDCCGCAACKDICSQKAISMKTDEEGFDYPFVDENKCVRCYMCINVCPFKCTKT